MNSNNRVSGKELRKSLNLIIIAYSFGIAFFIVTGGAPLTGFTRKLGASDLVYGIIMAMPVIGGILQVFASYFIENTGKRKHVFLIAGFTNRLLWIPIALIPLFLPINSNTVKIWAVTMLITLSSASSSISNIAFFSWMGSLVPGEIRGRFFSKRTTVYTITGAIAGLAVGLFLGNDPTFTRFAIVFMSISFLGVTDIFCFLWVKDPPMEVPTERIPFLKLFSQPFADKRYMRFILFVSVWNFGVNFAGPFFNVYMIEYLKMSYFYIILFTQITSNFSTIFFIRFWGRLVDEYGNKPIMVICCSVIFMLPLLWCFSTPSNFLVIIFISLLSGVFWPGFELTSMNLSMGLAPDKNRSIYIANYTLITSIIGIALAFICGGAFMQFSKPIIENLNLPFFLGQKFSNFHALFIGAVIFRLLAFVIFLPRVKEENSKSSFTVINDVLQKIREKVGISSKDL